MALTPTAAQLSILQLNQAMLGIAAGSTIMASALPTYTNANAYAKTLFQSNSAWSALDTTQAYTKLITNLAAGTPATAADISTLAAAVAAETGTGKALASVTDGLSLITAAFYITDPTKAGVWGTAINQFKNKVAVDAYYTLDKGIAVASSSVSASVNADPASITVAVDTMDTNTLTVYTDNLSGSVFEAPQAYTPGGNDFVNTLQDVDKLTGTGTSNILNATLGNANDNGAVIITPQMTNINVINAAFVGSGANAVTDLDLQDTTGLNTINISRVTQAINVAEVGNIMSVLTNMSLSNTNANQTGLVEYGFGAGVLAGSNTGAMALSNVQLATLNIGENTSGINARGVGARSYETLNLSSAGAANTVSRINLPMDTGTAGVVNISGSQNLSLVGAAAITNAGQAEAMVYDIGNGVRFGAGIRGADGRMSSVNAAELTGNLTMYLHGGIFTTGKADTSGVRQNVSITGGTGNDTFYLADQIEAGDSLTGGNGTDTLVVVNGGLIDANSSVVGSIETLRMELSNVATAVDFDKLASVTGVTLRNISNNGALAPISAAGTDTFTLNNMTATQAAAITIQHSTTGSNGIIQNIVAANLKTATGASDTVALTIAEGTNVDPRFNVTLQTNAVENITINDNDTESNTVALGSIARHTGTLTLNGGLAGTFINLDTTTAGANGGLYSYQTNGATDVAGSIAANGQIIDRSMTANQVKFSGATIAAGTEASNVIVRVSTSSLATGAQSITTGSGNDTVIFDNVSDINAGLTISDTVAGGTGTDTLVIDGNLTVAGTISLSNSEWTNVTGFENIRLVYAGDSTVAQANGGGLGRYNLTLTNELIAANKDANGYINIFNDNDPVNNANVATTATALDLWNAAQFGAESVAIINGLQLNAASYFSYKGEEGASRTADRFILSNGNVHGKNIINGGAIDNDSRTNSLANGDVLEIRNNADCPVGDLANLSNIGTIAFNNDQAVNQLLTLQLNDTVVDALVDSFHTASITENERLNVTLDDGSVDNGLVQAASSVIDMNLTAMTGATSVNFTDDGGGAFANAGADIVRVGFRGAGAGHTLTFAAGADQIIATDTTATNTVTLTGALVGAVDTITAAYTAAGSLTVLTDTYVNSNTAAHQVILDYSNFAGAVGVAGNLSGFTFVNTKTIGGSAGADYIVGGAGAQTINCGAGADTVVGGAGIDTIDLGAADGAVDIVRMDAVNGQAAITTAANRDVITSFVTTSDKVQLATAVTTHAAGGTVTNGDTTAAGAGGGAYGLGVATTGNTNVVLLRNGGALLTAGAANSGSLAAVTDGSNLLKALTNGTTAAGYTGITAAAAGQSVYFQAQQDGSTFIYYGSDANGNSLITADEIALVGQFTAAVLVAGDFQVA